MSASSSNKNPRPLPPEGDRPAPSPAGIVPLSFVKDCLQGTHAERPRKGQGRREPRHSRRKGP
jgi:hypothetical protein